MTGAQDVAPDGITCKAARCAQRAAEYAGGRIPIAEEVAETIACLASDEASGVCGESIAVALGGLW